jgi:ABC-type phosphate transport system substrate-binding protein
VQCSTSPATVTVGGSSLALRVISLLANAYNSATGPCSGGALGGGGTVRVDNDGVGTCLNQMLAHTRMDNFCGTDIPYTDQDWATADTSANLLQTIPIAEVATAVAYNEPCAGNAVRLTGVQLSGVYSGELTDWNTITSACPAGTVITAGVYGVPSGTTAAFKSYLFKSDPPTWTSFPPPDTGTSWPGPTKTCNGASDRSMAACLSNGTSNIIYISYSAVTGLILAAVDNANPTDFSTPRAGACTLAATGAVRPMSTFAGWSHVSITDGPVGYGICSAKAQAGALLLVTT